jgi:pilus assembly protein CpaB
MNSVVLRVIAIALAVGAVVIGYIGYQTSQPPESATLPTAETATVPKAAALYTVVVAAHDIAAGQLVDDADVTTLSLENKPAYGYTSTDAVVARRTQLPISTGELLLDEHFQDVSPVVAAIGPGQRAVAVRVDEVTGAGGFIKPGDNVDVLLFLAAGQENGKTSSAQRILSDVRVLAYGDAVDSIDREAVKQKSQPDNLSSTQDETRKASTKDEDVAGKKSKTAVLAVAETALSTLLLAESSGRLRLALVGTQTPVDKEKAVWNSLLEQQKATQQWVTLDTFKPQREQLPVPAAPSRAVSSSPATVTVLRGAQTSTVSVSKEE